MRYVPKGKWEEGMKIEHSVQGRCEGQSQKWKTVSQYTHMQHTHLYTDVCRPCINKHDLYFIVKNFRIKTQKEPQKSRDSLRNAE